VINISKLLGTAAWWVPLAALSIFVGVDTGLALPVWTAVGASILGGAALPAVRIRGASRVASVLGAALATLGVAAALAAWVAMTTGPQGCSGNGHSGWDLSYLFATAALSLSWSAAALAAASHLTGARRSAAVAAISAATVLLTILLIGVLVVKGVGDGC
jgi:hypothetical protein